MSCKNSCEQLDPCGNYDNCGCTNPTTFKCVTYTGDDLPCSGIENGDTGDDILDKIDEKLCDVGKILINGDDNCPTYLFDKIEAGMNISFQITGTGCERKLTIHAVEGGTAVDVAAKVSLNDTTSSYLNNKISVGSFLAKSITSPGGNEQLKLDVNMSSLISSDTGNQIVLGTDGALKTSYSPPDGSETKIVNGTGVTVTGSGTLLDPYVLSINPSITAARSCFDGVWRPIMLSATGNANVVYVSGAPEYRYRFDGSIEFKGSLTYTVDFGAYSSGDRKYTITAGSIPTTCLSSGEQAGTADLKNMHYIDVPQASADQIVQQYGYIIRKSTANIIIEFQSAFTSATSKTIVVNFDGAISHPSI